MIPFVSAVFTVINGSSTLMSFGSLLARTRVTALGSSTLIPARAAVGAAKSALRARGFGSFGNLSFDRIQSAMEVAEVLLEIAIVAWPENEQAAEDRVTRVVDYNNVLATAHAAQTVAQDRDLGELAVSESLETLEELFKEVGYDEFNALLNLVFGPHLARLRGAGYAFQLPRMNERSFWWDSLETSDEGVDTPGLTSVELVFFTKILCDFFGTVSASYSPEVEAALTVAIPTDHFAVARKRALIAETRQIFSGSEAEVLVKIINASAAL